MVGGKWLSEFPEIQGNICKLLALSDQLSETQRDSVYKDMKHRKAENPHITKAGTIKFVAFLLVTITRTL